MNFKILRNRNFLTFIFGQTTSSLGTNILHFATAFYVLELTGSAGKFASIVALGMIPNLILGPIAGTITDRVDRKKMIILADLIRGVLDILLFIYSLFGNISIEIMYGFVIFFSICEVFFEPAFTTILPSIISKDDLADAIAIKRTIGRIVSVASPVIGALILNINGFGIVLLIDGVTYLVSACSEIFIEIPLIKNINKKSSFSKDIVEGFKVLFINKRITSLISNNIITNIFILPFIFVGFPYIIIELLGGTQLDYGAVQSIATTGAILSIVAVGVAKRRYNINQCICIGIIFMILSCILIFPLISNDFINLIKHNSLLITIFFGIIIFIFRLSNTFYEVFYSTFYQTIIPSNILGRYVAVQSSLITIGRLIGIKLFGYLFDNHDLIIPIIILGMSILLKIIVHIPFVEETKNSDIQIKH